ncbi:MAG: antibiotic biosynthesis monooxygenase [Dokdonia sp.]|jgi:heme-degrading monooxygenase HmoA
MAKKPPYYAVIFTSVQTEQNAGYKEMSQLMEELAKQQVGYLGLDHARSALCITISYWETLEDIARWKQQTDHLAAQRMGQKQWYKHYEVQIAKVERVYSFDALKKE